MDFEDRLISVMDHLYNGNIPNDPQLIKDVIDGCVLINPDYKILCRYLARSGPKFFDIEWMKASVKMEENTSKKISQQLSYIKKLITF